MIRPIETSYRGYRFRSRLEARWAIYFDALNLKWEYEKEGFILGKRKYLPDFWLNDVKMWGEVKPERPFDNATVKLLYKLAKATKRPVLMLGGTPEPTSYWAVENSDIGRGKYGLFMCDYFLSNYKDYPKREHRFYGGVGPEYPELEDVSGDKWQGMWADSFDDVIYAAMEARSARFEFGENGRHK